MLNKQLGTSQTWKNIATKRFWIHKLMVSGERMVNKPVKGGDSFID